MATEPGIAARTRTTGGRVWRRWLKIVIALVAVAAIAILLILSIDGTSGGPSYPWDRFLADARSMIRDVWAGLTGRSIQQDLFP